MASAHFVFSNSRSITHLANYLSQNLPMNSSDESKNLTHACHLTAQSPRSLEDLLFCGRFDRRKESGVHRFIDLNLTITRDICESLHDSAWPTDFDTIRNRAVAKPEMHPRVACRHITAGGRQRDPLRTLGSCQLHERANPVPVTPVPGQVKRDPVVRGGRLVEKNVRGSPIRGDHCIDAAVVVDVADRHAASYPCLVK